MFRPIIVSLAYLASSASAVNYRAVDTEILKLHTQVRTNPKSLIPYLTTMLNNFEGNLLVMPGKTRMRTNEGPAAVKEAINFLKNQKPVGSMSLANALKNACKYHTLD